MNEIITESPSIISDSISSSIKNNSIKNMLSNNSLDIDYKSNWQQNIKYLLILFILALLGFNLFKNLGNFIDIIINFFSPLTNLIGVKTGDVLETTAKGVRGLGNISGNIIESGVDLVKNDLDGDKNDTIQISDPLLVDEEPEPDKIDSNIQTKPKTGTGYCYVGEDRNIRSCVKINKKHKCMSGDIFPTREICINPNLRY